MRKAYVMLLVGFLVFNVQAQNQEHKAYHNNGKIKESGFLDENGEKTGEWKYYDATVGVGKLSEIGSFLNGKKTGEWKSYHYGDIESLSSIENYLNGERIGEWKRFWADGSLRENGFTDEYGNKDYKCYYSGGAPKWSTHQKKGTDIHEFRRYYRDGQVQEVGLKNKLISIGEWKYYYDNGQLRSIGNYEEEGGGPNLPKRTGEWKFYHKNGQLSSIGIYLDYFERKGEWKTYYDNGQLSSIGIYEQYISRKGQWKFYDETGQLFGIGEYLNKKPYNGKFMMFHPDGKLASKGSMLEGKQTGEWKIFDETGKLTRTQNFNSKGEPEIKEADMGENQNTDAQKSGNANTQKKEYKLYYPNEQLREVGYKLDGERVGERKGFYDNGQLREVGSYEKNKPTGEWKTYHKDGRLKSSIIFANGLPKEMIEYYEDESIKSQIQYAEEDKQITRKVKNFYKNGQVESVGYDDGYNKIGEWKMYYKNGQLKDIGSYSSNEIASGRKVGKWKTYNEDGQLQPIENYLNGMVESPVSQEEYNSKLLFQADKSIIGKWYGLDSSQGDNENFHYWEFKEDGTFTFYDGKRNNNQGFVYDGKYKIDSSKYPMHIDITRSDDNSEGRTEINPLVFLSENEVRVLDLYYGTLEVGPIFSRIIEGEKNYFDFEMPKMKNYVPTASNKISDKELMEFWENTIQESIATDGRKKLYYWQHGTGPRQLIYPTSNKELREGLQDMNYKDIEQIQLDDGEVLLMVYFLGKRYFQDAYDDFGFNYRGVKHRSIHYGLLFKKGSDGWKLINTLTSSDYKGGRDITQEAIKSNQNELINQGVFNIELRSFANQSLPAFINLETDKIVAQTNFPLKGNWGIAFGLPVNASTWKKSDFEANITKLINEDDRNRLSESYNNGWIHMGVGASIDYFREYGTNEEPSKNISLVPLIFTLEHLNGKLEVD
ncbi:hypothetical protein OAD62_06695, partial [Oceanihabitans sp.]|nr:hypothetical protein [Oceanihabitans sp.]